MEKETQEKVNKPSVGAKVYKIFGIALNVVLYVFLAFSIFLLIVSIASKRDSDGAVNVFGYEMRIVASSSMEKSEFSADVSAYKIKDLKVRSAVFVQRVPEDEERAGEWYSALAVGDVLTFRYVTGGSQETVTHRITEIEPTASGYIISLQGDNRAEGASVSTQTIYTSPQDYPNQNAMYNYVIGKVVGNSTALGYLVYSVKQPLGVALMVIVPCSVIIIWQAVRIISVVNESKKKKAEAAVEELEELKRKYAELERKNSDGGDR